VPFVNEFGIISRTAAPSVLPYKDFLLLSYQPLNFKEKNMEWRKKSAAFASTRTGRKGKCAMFCPKISLCKGFITQQKKEQRDFAPCCSC
jgi:hypothetical protein